MSANIQKLHNIISAAIEKADNLPYAARATADRLRDFTFHTEGYSEPGYLSLESGVIAVGNWNDITQWDDEAHQSVTLSDLPGRVAKVLEERYGADLIWEDEWQTCNHCQKLIRTQADSYDWQRYWVDLEDDIICGDCLKSDRAMVEEYLENLEGDTRACLTINGLCPENHGYKLFKEKLENGFHDGMAADPKVIAKELRAQGVERFLFTLDAASQFYLMFSVYVHQDDWEKVSAPKWSNVQLGDRLHVQTAGYGRIESTSDSKGVIAIDAKAIEMDGGFYFFPEQDHLLAIIRDDKELTQVEIKTDAAISPAQRLQEGLRQLATLPVVTPEGQKGITVAELGSNEAGRAKVTVRTITPQQFIDGDAFNYEN